MSKNVVVEIVNQPRSVERFRYESEKRPNRSNLAINPRTNASIRVLNYTGPVTVVVSCVTTEKPYRQHPNILVGEDCKRGVCKIDFKTDKSDPTVYTFNNMTIQCIKKVDIEKSLTEREKCNVDPFKKGFKHKKDKTFKPGVRLCFQVFTGSGDKFTPVHPIVSDIIRGKDNLEICDISDTTSPTTGAKKIIVFCSKVSKGDIKVRFYRENENAMVEWEALVQKPIVVHRQAAIVFDTPAYETNDIMEPVDVLLELVRPSDGKRSEPARSFRYVPDPLNVFNLIRKKEQKINRSEVLFQYIEQRGDEKQSLAKTQQLNFKPNIPIVPNIPPMNHNIPPIVPNIPPMNHNNSPMNHKVPPMNTNVSPMNTNVTPMNTNHPPMNHNVPLMNSNVPPMNTNQYFNTSTTTRPPATQSNLMSNFYLHDEAPINGQSVPHQTTHFDNRRYSQDQIQHHSAQSDRCQHGGERSPLQVNQFHHRYHPHGSLQLQHSDIEPMITTQSHNDNACNPSHGQLQQYQPLSYHQTYPSHGQSQPQNIHSELQSSSNHQKHSHNASQTFHPAQNSRQPQFNSYLQHQQEQQQYYQQEQQQYYQQEQQQYYQQEQQQCYQQEQQQYYQQEHHHQQEQQHYIQSNFQDMPANSEYGKYLSSAAPYCPIPSFYTEHEQSVYANNFVSEGNIENASNTYIHY